jgi:GNAT superfamily N-acetyltransferase
MSHLPLPPLSAPVLLEAEHDCSAFSCLKHPSLADWLQRRGLQNQRIGGSAKTYVVCAANQVVGYYALATGAIELEFVPGAFRRNMPDPVPMLVLGRLAVHSAWEGKGIGTGLLKDAVLRCMEAAKIIGCRGILCHAIDEEAKHWYLKRGFVESPREPLSLLLSLKI